MKNATIGIFGGSGFYQLGDDVEKIMVDTPYGIPSSPVFVATIEGKRVAFLPRHGVEHNIPPHKINYRANLWAMKEVGVKSLISPSACGSLQLDIKPGDFVFCDQFVNMTRKREDTFFDGPLIGHLNCADPYCASLRKIAFIAADALNISYHKEGTIVVIEGPRFSSKAESRRFHQNGWQVINMSQYPEVVLARELGMCSLNISLITDYDSGLDQEEHKSTHANVLKVVEQNTDKLKSLLFKMIADMPEELTCDCDNGLDGVF